YSGYQAGWNSKDTSEVAVEYLGLDESGNHKRLTIWWSGRLTSSKVWRGKSHTRVAPVGTRFVKIHLFARHGGGWFNNNNDAYFDALSFVHLPIDRDGDGIPNVKEVELGLNPDDAADAVLDLDGDGFSNIQEYTAGTGVNNVDDFPDLNIKAFYVDKTQIGEANEAVTLNWQTFGAETIEVFEGETLIHTESQANLAGWDGQLVVNPSVSTTYKLVIKDSEKSRENSLLVELKPRVNLPEWPEPLPEDHDFILDSLTLLADGSHYVSSKNDSYYFYQKADTTKTQKWQIDDLGQVHHKATLVNGLAIVGTTSTGQSKGKVVAIHPDGTIAWQYEADSSIKTKPIADTKGKTLYVVGYYGKVIALDAFSGTELWFYQIPEDNLIVVNAPALKEEAGVDGLVDLSNSQLIVRTTANNVFAIALDDRQDRIIWSKAF
ncbi:MAG: PQQ-binding-like beta-propeller repeat protein, partial [Cellvibrionales bacterium]|nr:PQQ-binding-like beta-propeller repeat protein [Cellvibrionales bacterium]